MIRLFTILIICFFSLIITAQTPWCYSLGAGILGSGRILTYGNTHLNDTEKNQLQILEVLKPGYMGSYGLEKEIRKKSKIELAIGYQYSGFGSKTFTIADTVRNTTPQFALFRESYIIHRIFLSSALSRTFFKRGKSSFFASGGSALFYSPRFVRRTYSIYEDGSTGIVSTTEKPLPEFPRLDISVQLRVGYERELGQNTALSIAPNLRYFVRPYPTRGDKVLLDYLFLKKKTTGHLYTFGLEVRFIKAIVR